MILINKELVKMMGVWNERYRVGVTVQNLNGNKFGTIWMAGVSTFENGLSVWTKMAEDAALMTEEAAMQTSEWIKVLVRAKHCEVIELEYFLFYGEEIWFCGLEKVGKNPAKPVNFRSAASFCSKKLIP